MGSFPVGAAAAWNPAGDLISADDHCSLHNPSSSASWEPNDGEWLEEPLYRISHSLPTSGASHTELDVPALLVNTHINSIRDLAISVRLSLTIGKHILIRLRHPT